MHRFLVCVLVAVSMIGMMVAAGTPKTEEVHVMKLDTTIPSLGRSVFDKETFEQFVEMRIGTGDPVYWYGLGVISSFPDGKVLARATARVSPLPHR